ncbi:hypothetical protein [Streptosporangium sp. NPDC051022]|uniref:hypothetical protein n=1 Tax=Streptosporangium sp. NPDC051022 TaxID=3155752 RepID=UPI00343CB430
MIAALAAAGLLAATPGIASATDGTPGFVSVANEPGVSLADEWYTSSTDPASKGYKYAGSSVSKVGGVWQRIEIQRENDNDYVALGSIILDEATDGYCAGAEIRYQVYDGGTWSGYHYRMIPSYDCSTNNDPVRGGWYYSRPKVRNISSRACHVNSSGAKIECEESWHEPY